MIAFGHWDTDVRSEVFNLIPTGQLAAAGITKAYTGHVHLADLGILGNGHMMMIEKNNQAIAGVMVDWLEAGAPTEQPTLR